MEGLLIFDGGPAILNVSVGLFAEHIVNKYYLLTYSTNLIAASVFRFPPLRVQPEQGNEFLRVCLREWASMLLRLAGLTLFGAVAAIPTRSVPGAYDGTGDLLAPVLLDAVNGECYPEGYVGVHDACLLYTSPSPRDQRGSRMPSSA